MLLWPYLGSRQLTRPCNFESDLALSLSRIDDQGPVLLFKFGVSICKLVIPAILIRYSALRAGDVITDTTV